MAKIYNSFKIGHAELFLKYEELAESSELRDGRNTNLLSIIDLSNKEKKEI